MRRRNFITLLGGAAAWPLAARAQQSKRIGVLMNYVATDKRGQDYITAFADQLRKLGWIDGHNLRIEYRWNAGDPALARSYAAELVALAPDVILCASTNNLIDLQRLSPTTPIVFIAVSDPVTQGFVLNMAHPGANITGFAGYEFTIGGKWVDLLKQMVPAITHIAVMFNSQTSPQSKFFISSVEAAAPTFRVSVTTAPVDSVDYIDTAIADFSRQQGARGLIFPTDAFITAHRKLFAEAAARYRVPAIYADADVIRDGGLMNYRGQFEDQYRQAGVYVDRILRGVKAGDLPVQALTKFSLGINLKSARDLGIDVPLSLLLIADEQIE
jgi:putative ABC transport system substrate-binding protein